MILNTSNILLLEKLIHLGKRLERTRIYELLEPWSLNGHEAVEVQKAGKKISNFIGLSHLTFIINYTQQEENTAGHIELNNNDDEGVFIEIDEDVKTESESILAILAHEICHKLIHINGLTQFGYENEILTDVATVYTGLGKLSLNGCKNRFGYLKREQFAFLYNVVCNMRKIPKKYALKGLNNEAINALKISQYNHDNELFHNDYANETVKSLLKQNNYQCHLALARNIKFIKTLQSNLETKNEAGKKIHEKIKLMNEKFLRRASESLSPERLNYIKNLILISELSNQNGLFDNEVDELNSINNVLHKWLLNHNGKFIYNLKERDVLYNIKCPVCAHTMRLKQDKLVIIKCRKCKYSFMVDNSIIHMVYNSTIETQKVIEYEKKTRTTLKSKFRKIIAILKQ